MLKTLDPEMDGKGVSLSPVGCDVAHGQNNIIKDACANNRMVLELVTAARTILKNHLNVSCVYNAEKKC